MTLKQIIQMRGMKQGWLAAKVGLTDADFSRMVTGKMPLPLRCVATLSEELRVSAKEVVDSVYEVST